MNSTRRFVVRTGSAVALLALLAFGQARAESTSYVFENQTLAFSHLVHTASGSAVGVNDPGFRNLLKSLGATLTWHPGERYVLIATPQPLVLNFSVGSKRYDNGLLSSTAAFAPFVQGGEVYLPFGDVMRALSLAIKHDGSATVLQPQLTSVDLQGSGSQAVLIAHAAVPLHARLVSEAPDHLTYAFDGVASSIDGSRTVYAGGVRSINVATSGNVRAPRATVTVNLAPNTRHDSPHSNSGDFELAFGANGGAPPLVAAAAAPGGGDQSQPVVAQQPVQQQPVQAQAPAPQDQPQPAQQAQPNVTSVTGVTVQGNDGGATVTIAVNGNATYEWHRLRAPDNRFWIDIKGAQLQGGPRDEAEADPLLSMRSRQLDPQTVRIALSI
ncbi:MAG TPA: AMIN domain-containing protein, partial [Candidatus Aquilonibacter sp.]|nr:AMIN domain-containing protein [Candidatus Aquilonibacter sp.]